MISIPTMEFYIPSLTMTPAFYNIGSDTAVQAVNDVDGVSYVEGLEDGANFGTIEIQGLTFTTLGGWIEIGPH